jgi:hypothetical protein
MDCTETAALLAQAQAPGCKSLLERDMLEIALLWAIAENESGVGGISCDEAAELLTESVAAGCKSIRERSLLEIALLNLANEEAGGSTMANLSCTEVEALLAQVQAAGCRSPWERELIKLALLSRIAGAGAITPTGIQIYVGIGSPEGVQTANPGSIYFDLTTPSAPIQYIKGSGTGNTGWI